MNCLEFRARLMSAVESHQPVDAASLAEHIRSCSACEQEWQRHQILAQAIEVWQETIPEVDLADVVVSRWLVEAPGPISFAGPASSSTTFLLNAVPPVAEQPEAIPEVNEILIAPASATSFRPQNERSRARQVLWIPASLLTLFFVLIWNADTSQGPSISSFTTRTHSRQQINHLPEIDRVATTGNNAIEKDNVPLPQLDTLIEDVESGYRELAQSAVTTISDAALLFPSAESHSFWPSSIMLVPELDGDNQPLPDNATTSPVSQGFSKALNLLLEIVPVTGPPTS